AVPQTGQLPLGGGALLRADGGDHGRRPALHPLRRLGGADGRGGAVSAATDTLAERAPGGAAGGRAEGRGARAWRWLREHAVSIVAALVVVYMLIPIAVILLFSFNDPAGRYNFTWVGFTLEHWGNAFGIPELTSALWTSVRLALLATLISTVIGTLMALALVRHRFFGRRAAN